MLIWIRQSNYPIAILIEKGDGIELSIFFQWILWLFRISINKKLVLIEQSIQPSICFLYERHKKLCHILYDAVYYTNSIDQ